jgi:transcriptional regulator with XRE-family HTH domain
MASRWEHLRALGARLRAARQAKGWTQDALARRPGAPDAGSVSLYERGARTPTPAHLRALCDLLTLAYDELAALAGYLGGAGPAEETAAARRPRLVAVGARLRTAREAHGWSQAELARRVGYTANTSIGLFERGMLVPPRDRLRRLCAVLDLDFDALAALAGSAVPRPGVGES